MKKLRIYALVQENPQGTVDLRAVEAAKALLPGEITALSLNEEKALRFALATGCSRAVLIQAEKEMSAYFQAEAYYDFLREQEFDLILASSYQSDWDSLSTEMILMERLQLPSLHFVNNLKREGGRIEGNFCRN